MKIMKLSLDTIRVFNRANHAIYDLTEGNRVSDQHVPASVIMVVTLSRENRIHRMNKIGVCSNNNSSVVLRKMGNVSDNVILW